MGEFARADADLAESGRRLLYVHGVGLGYLATLRNDGAPRLHPICPVVHREGLYVFVGNHSPKLADLRRDPRYAMHSFPMAERDDEFYVAGAARAVENDGEYAEGYETYAAQGTTTTDDTLFELLLDRALHSAYAELLWVAHNPNGAGELAAGLFQVDRALSLAEQPRSDICRPRKDSRPQMRTLRNPHPWRWLDTTR